MYEVLALNPSVAQTVVGGDGDRGVQGHYWLPAQLEPSLGTRETLFTNQQEDLIESELKSNVKNSPEQDCPLPRAGSGG